MVIRERADFSKSDKWHPYAAVAAEFTKHLSRGWIFASDGGAARQFAQKQGIRLTGTLGISIEATTIGLLDRSEADTIHARMVDEGYRSPLAYDRGIYSFLNRPPN